MAQPQYSSDNNTSRAPAEASRGTFRPPGQYQYPSAGFENPQGYGGPPLAQALHRNHVLLPRAAVGSFAESSPSRGARSHQLGPGHYTSPTGLTWPGETPESLPRQRVQQPRSDGTSSRNRRRRSPQDPELLPVGIHISTADGNAKTLPYIGKGSPGFPLTFIHPRGLPSAGLQPVDLPATGEIQQPFITPLGLVSPTKYVDLVASLERHEITARPMRMLVLDDDVPHNGIDIHFGRPFLEEYGARLLLVPSVPAASNSQANVWQSSYVGAQAQASTHLSTATSGSSQGLDSSPSVTTITSEGTPNSTSLGNSWDTFHWAGPVPLRPNQQVYQEPAFSQHPPTSTDPLWVFTNTSDPHGGSVDPRVTTFNYPYQQGAQYQGQQ